MTTAQRFRIRFSRTGPACDKSHIKQIDCLRRSLMASGWPLEMSQTKRPKVRASFGPAISVGYESQSEYVDVDLAERISIKEGKEKLGTALEEGYTVEDIKSIPRFFPSLEESSNVGFYEIQSEALTDTKPAWEKFWALETLPVVKKVTEEGETIKVDARPLVRSWKLKGSTLYLELRFGPGRTLKPEKIVQAVCNLDEQTPLKICRTKLCFEKQNGDLIEL